MKKTLFLALLLFSPSLVADVWVVSFLCGSNPVTDNRVVQGQYATTVIVTNRGFNQVRPRFELSFIFPPEVFTPPNSLFPIPGELSQVRFEEIQAGRAVSIDCEEFQLTDAFSTGPIGFPPYVQGSLVIRNAPKRRVDVQVLYSARSLSGDGISLTHVPVAPR